MTTAQRRFTQMFAIKNSLQLQLLEIYHSTTLPHERSVLITPRDFSPKDMEITYVRFHLGLICDVYRKEISNRLWRWKNKTAYCGEGAAVHLPGKMCLKGESKTSFQEKMKWGSYNQTCEEFKQQMNIVDKILQVKARQQRMWQAQWKLCMRTADWELAGYNQQEQTVYSETRLF